MNMKRMRWWAVAGIFAAVLSHSQSMAATVTYSFGGTINSATSGLEPSIQAGNHFSGTLSYDPSTVGLPTGNTVEYPALTSFQFTVGSFSAASTLGPFNIGVKDDGLSQVWETSANSWNAPTIGGFLLGQAIIQLEDKSRTAFNNLALLAALDLSDFGIASFTASFGKGEGISGSIEQLSLVETPLPAALPLYATGLGVMGFIGWRRRRKTTARLAR
jgi:hypothetical protein